MKPAMESSVIQTGKSVFPDYRDKALSPWLRSGETRTVSLAISPEFYDVNMDFVIEPGEFGSRSAAHRETVIGRIRYWK